MDLSWLRKRPPKERTSTYRSDSMNAILGEAGEVIVVGRIQKILEEKGLGWKVGRTGSFNSRTRTVDLGPCPETDDPWVPIENSRLGDVHVVDHRGRRRLSFEVKASLEHDNAAIGISQLDSSEAEFLVAITKAGFWVCSMAEARENAYRKTSAFGTFYVVPYAGVKKINLRDLFPEL